MATITAIVIVAIDVIAIVIVVTYYEPYPCPSLLHLGVRVDRVLASEVRTMAEPLLILTHEI